MAGSGAVLQTLVRVSSQRQARRSMARVESSTVTVALRAEHDISTVAELCETMARAIALDGGR